MNRRLFLSILLVSCLTHAVAEERPSPETVRQWQSRKYGMFIHFGLFSTLGGVWNGKQYSGNYSEQIQSDAHIPGDEYAALAERFNPQKWDADAVVQLAADAGMKFIVLTAKHHDGFNMFATKQSKFNVVDATPYGRDVVKSLAEACKRRGMPFGVYYSSIDWHYGDVRDQRNDNPLTAAHEEFNVAQLRELLTNYGPISEIWFDMSHPTPLQSRHFADTVHGLQPQCLISGRVFNSQGDFGETGDDDIPDFVNDEPWESPASIYAETWGYRSWQKQVPLHEKIEEHILRLVKVTSRGGNYLLNIGPKGDGAVVDYEADVLRGVGRWVHKNGEAIYDTAPQPFRKLDFGYATVKGDRLYLFVEQMPGDGVLRLPGLQNRLLEAAWLGGKSGGKIEIDNAGLKSIGVTAPANEFLPVLAVKFAGDLKVMAPVTQADEKGTVKLLPKDADHFFNSNGEGYYDPPTVRAETWHFAVSKTGTYKIEIAFKAGAFSRVVDVRVGNELQKAVLHGNAAQTAAAAGSAKLTAGQDLTLTLGPGAPAERGAKLDVEIVSVNLTPVGQ